MISDLDIKVCYITKYAHVIINNIHRIKCRISIKMKYSEIK